MACLNGRLLLFSVATAFALFVVYQNFGIRNWLELVPGHADYLPSKQRIIEENLGIFSSKQNRPIPHHFGNDASANSSDISSQLSYSDLTKTVIVAAQSHENTSWVTHELPAGWNHVVMVVDNTMAPHHTPMNKGREAAAYLWYILDNYHELPDTMVFMHSHRSGELEAWHVDNEAHSNPLSIERLRIAAVQERGFVNLRCQTKPGCPIAIQLARDPPDPDLQTEFAMPEAVKIMFDMEPPYPAPVIAAPCCSQFAVSKQQMHERPRSDYEKYWKWLTNTKLNDAISGRVFEHLWHIIFGRPMVYCPDPQDCYCVNYGQQCHE